MAETGSAAFNPAISAGISGGSGLLGSIFSGAFGLAAQKRANEMNYKIWQEQKEFNAAEAQKSRDFEEYMWNLNNEYNSASAQRERLEEAGLNPYMMLNGGSAGTGMGISSSAAANAGNAPTMRAYDPQNAVNMGVQSVVNSLNSYYNNKLNEENAGLVAAEREGQEIENENKQRMIDAQLGEIIARTGLYSEQEISAALMNKWSEETMDERIRAVGLQNSIREGQIQQLKLSNENQEIINKYVDKQQQMQLQLAAAQIYELYARGELNRAEAKNAIAQSYYYTWVGNGAQLEFHKAMSVAEDWIETKTAELKYQRGTYHGEGTFFERLLGITPDAEDFGASVASANLGLTDSNILLNESNRKYLDSIRKTEDETRNRKKRGLTIQNMANVVGMLTGTGKDVASLIFDVIGPFKGKGKKPVGFSY